LTSVVTHAAIAVHRHEVSNFEAKTPTQTFDRVKYMEEFRKKLNSFPKGYKKPVKSWVPTPVTISTPHTTAKAYGIEKFDKHKFAEEFRKKLMAFPEGYITKGKVDFSKLLESTSPSLANSPLSPDVAPIPTPIVDDVGQEKEKQHRLESHELATVQAGTNSSSLEEGRAAWPREQNVHALTSSAALSMESENKSAQHMLGNFSRPRDLCDELLDPKLEEDCSNENWELKWFFNSERGACKSFWYGGCETNARNFFGDVKSCRTTCGHKMFMQKDAPHPHNYNRPSMLPPIFSPSSSMPVSPVVSEVSLSSTNAASVATTSDVSAELERHIVGIPSIVSSGGTDGNETSIIGTNQTNTSGDICDEGYDPKWDEVGDFIDIR
uniref:BPTI/Kunitz inhibitor domain-containing protein n=1 Tax=Angiostrongylus cantonensis TaxID=6313 RepID=A0A0K0D4C7_ANGCA